MSLLTPTWQVKRLSDLDVAWLAQKGVRLVLLDRDNTVAKPKEDRVDPDALGWVARAKELGLECVIVSNNTHAALIKKTASELGLSYVHAACKPLPFALRTCMRRLGVSERETCVVGDQVLTDILASKLAGAYSCLVEPLATEPQSEMVWSRCLRAFGRRLLGRRDGSGS